MGVFHKVDTQGQVWLTYRSRGAALAVQGGYVQDFDPSVDDDKI